MIGKISLLVFVLLSASSCFKEVAKKPYDLVLTFSSGDVYTITDVIYEKDKKYIVNGSEDEVMKGYDDNMILFGSRTFFYSDDHYLVAVINDQLTISNCAFANGQDIVTEGSINLEGKYKSPFRKIKVEEGTFELHWGNAEDYGMSDQVVTGTWALKRK